MQIDVLEIAGEDPSVGSNLGVFFSSGQRISSKLSRPIACSNLLEGCDSTAGLLGCPWAQH